MRYKYWPHLLLLTAIIFVDTSLFGKVKLPRLISDGMVLQRDKEIKIWGWASPGENISVSFNDNHFSAVTDNNGEWYVYMNRYPAGGPFTMIVSGEDTVSVGNILIGEVWVCSGQSNMEMPVRRVSPIYQAEIATSKNDRIRQFKVPRAYNFKIPQTDVSRGEWISADPNTVMDFSAVAYFFARELNDKYDVPVGIINTALGGSPAEAWMSEEAIKAFPEHYQEAQKFKDDNLIKDIEQKDNARIRDWYNILRQTDEGYSEADGFWYKPELNISSWESINVPGYWSGNKLQGVNGVVWYRKDFSLPDDFTQKPAKLILGRIVDADSVYINGTFIGTTSYQYPPRRYDIPINLLKEGRNTIVARVISSWGVGGFVPDKKYEIVVGTDTFDISGEWFYRVGARMDPLAGQTFVNWKPTGLFNAMINPLVNFAIKGVLWYQGESNADRPAEYRSLFPALINDWRAKWALGEFPFLFVQLPNFMEAKDEPSESNWALFREAQMKALSIPNTGMAVAIDVGAWNDIHPLNKKDVGVRLAQAAKKVAYNDTLNVSFGPIIETIQFVKNRAIISFKNVGGGLVVKGNELNQFAIAGADKNFVWAKARIENNKVIVWNDNITKPVAVRYAWADNPAGANLYNVEGFPAAPFRTDEF